MLRSFLLSPSQRRIHTSAVFLGIFMMLGFSAFHVQNALAVLEGKGGDHMPKTVFAAGGGTNTGQYLMPVGTVQSVRYPRCFVTAGHVSDPRGGALVNVMAGEDVRKLTDDVKRQPVDKNFVATRVKWGGAPEPWKDVGVFLAENFKKGPKNPNPIEYTYYEPKEFADVSAYQLLGWKKNEDNEALEPFQQPEWEANKAKSSPIVGYGSSGSVQLPKPKLDFIFYRTHEDIGQNMKRLGTIKAVGYFWLTDAGIIKTRKNPNINCRMDSGSAFWDGGGIAGVLSGGFAEEPLQKKINGDTYLTRYCANTTIGLYAGFNKTAAKDGNLDWANEKVELLCKDAMNTRIPDGHGKVEGTVLAGSFDTYSYDELNDSIDCEDPMSGDCVEYIHEGETIELHAIADTGYHFSHWDHVPGPKEYVEGNWYPIEQCPCVGSGSGCTVNHSQLGYYSATESHESSTCDAFFAPDECGNTTLEGEEECDEGGETDSCDYDCTEAACGDGHENGAAGEQCDDGNTSNDDGCSATCQIETNYCGDGIKDASEQCDDGLQNGSGTESQYCNADCTFVNCGDEIVNEEAGEECDDGNDDNGDGCNVYCKEETCGNGVVDSAGEECDDGSATASCNADCTAAFCGDGDVGAGEACDDGNDDDGDGCSNECLVEEEICGDGNVDTGEDCDEVGMTLACNDDCTTPSCGDGVYNWLAGEECDDGNNTSLDGCSSTCQDETGDYCGDGNVDTGEQCDDGNQRPNDGCFVCRTEGCGDAFVQTGEQCDDGNSVNGDGCDAYCDIELTYCGNGTIDHYYEQCDDGNNYDYDGCSATCTSEYCGNLIVEMGEYCDTATESSTCDYDCSEPECGDWVLNYSAGEQCDTGGSETSECNYDCTLPECGDGITNMAAEEECDDGDTDNGDGCDETCHYEYGSSSSASSGGMEPFCGDGNVDMGEECDDGDNDNGDGCSAMCELEESGGSSSGGMGGDGN